MYSTFNTLGAQITILIALFFSSINAINAVIAITPAGFGISEGIIVLLAHTIGIGYLRLFLQPCFKEL